MNKLVSRLARLEARGADNNGGGSGCSVCRGWRRIESTDWRTSQKVSRGAPVKCPDCGRAIPTTKVEEIEDWRGERAIRPV